MMFAVIQAVSAKPVSMIRMLDAPLKASDLLYTMIVGDVAPEIQKDRANAKLSLKSPFCWRHIVRSADIISGGMGSSRPIFVQSAAKSLSNRTNKIMLSRIQSSSNLAED